MHPPSDAEFSSGDEAHDEILGLPSSSDDGEGFIDSADDLFEKYVDVGVETFDGANKSVYVEDPVELRDEEDVYNFDEFRSIDGSDDEGKRKSSKKFFNPTDLKKDIIVQRCVIFSDNFTFRQALTQLSMDTSGDCYFLHNDKERVTTYCKRKCDCPTVRIGRSVCAKL